MFGHKVRRLFRCRERVNFAGFNTQCFGTGQDQIVHRRMNVFCKQHPYSIIKIF